MKKIAKNASRQLSGNYVLYGFMKSQPSETGYLAMIPRSPADEVIADEISAAMTFDASQVEHARKYINEEFADMYGKHAFVFHPVKVNFMRR